MKKCHICKTELDQPGRPDTTDCGGDCRRCMALYGDDPDERRLMHEYEPGNPQWFDDDQDTPS